VSRFLDILAWIIIGPFMATFFVWVLSLDSDFCPSMLVGIPLVITITTALYWACIRVSIKSAQKKYKRLMGEL
jgi:hypothetical protein